MHSVVWMGVVVLARLLGHLESSSAPMLVPQRAKRNGSLHELIRQSQTAFLLFSKVMQHVCTGHPPATSVHNLTVYHGTA